MFVFVFGFLVEMLRLQIARKIRERETDRGCGSSVLVLGLSMCLPLFPISHFPQPPTFPSLDPLSQGIFISQLRTELDGSVGMCSAFLNNRIRERQLRGGTAPTHSSNYTSPPPPPPPRPPSPAINQTMQQTHAWPKGWGRSPPAFCLVPPASCLLPRASFLLPHMRQLATGIANLDRLSIEFICIRMGAKREERGGDLEASATARSTILSIFISVSSPGTKQQ